MEVGQPSEGAPAAVLAAASESMATTTLAYTPALGLTALRERIALHYKEYYDVQVNYRNIAITTGSSGAFLLSFLAAFDEGDKVVITPPSYPCYRAILTGIYYIRSYHLYPYTHPYHTHSFLI